MDIQTCPRRMQEMGPWEQREGVDEWKEEPRREGEVTPFCSFCGSLHPGKFLELVAQGWSVEPTDKNYKAYLSQVQSVDPRWANPGEPLPGIPSQARAKFYYQHLSKSQQQQFIGLYNKGMMRIAMPGHFYVTPFFVRTAQRGPGDR